MEDNRKWWLLSSRNMAWTIFRLKLFALLSAYQVLISHPYEWCHVQWSCSDEVLGNGNQGPFLVRWRVWWLEMKQELARTSHEKPELTRGNYSSCCAAGIWLGLWVSLCVWKVVSGLLLLHAHKPQYLEPWENWIVLDMWILLIVFIVRHFVMYDFIKYNSYTWSLNIALFVSQLYINKTATEKEPIWI